MSVTKIDKAQAVKIIKAAAYVTVSAVIAYFISLITEQPELFGVYTPIINIVLVTVKQLFTNPDS